MKPVRNPGDMRLLLFILMLALFAGGAVVAQTSPLPAASPAPATGKAKPEKAASGLDVSADQSLEWYQDQKLYVARGNAKAIRGDMTITSDLMTAHQRDAGKDAKGQKQKPAKDAAAAPDGKPAGGGDAGMGGDIDKMTAEGNVHIVDPRQNIYGDHAVYDLDKHEMILTGQHLRYITPKETVTAKDSLEYYEDKKIAIARGHAIADSADRHVEGDILSAEFRDMPNGESQLDKMTATGHVTVITKTDVSKGDRAVYDAGRNIAILNGNVQVTRPDNTQLTGDVGEVDFTNNQSRLLNDGTGRVRALLPPKTTDGATTAKPAQTAAGSGPAGTAAP